MDIYNDLVGVQVQKAVGNMSWSRSLLKAHISELCRSFVETSLSYMSDKTYASCRKNEFNRFSECKKCKLKSEMQEKNLLKWIFIMI
jgi:hypothetical protein